MGARRCRGEITPSPAFWTGSSGHPAVGGAVLLVALSNPRWAALWGATRPSAMSFREAARRLPIRTLIRVRRAAVRESATAGDAQRLAAMEPRGRTPDLLVANRFHRSIDAVLLPQPSGKRIFDALMLPGFCRRAVPKRYQWKRVESGWVVVTVCGCRGAFCCREDLDPEDESRRWLRDGCRRSLLAPQPIKPDCWTRQPATGRLKSDGAEGSPTGMTPGRLQVALAEGAAGRA